ncbi:putative DUF676 domain-containing protein [Seiridium cardinale]|uniref:DUF676 domain-containing protein n=1 Tax=Seiridium cardinale TaxID=138064 RepID=A0ABR2XQM2_9PEZI
MGGLVLLASRASAETHLQQILECTRGIIFMGTPHSGSGLALFAQRFSKLLNTTISANVKILGVLKRDSEVLARIQGDFHSMIRNRVKSGCAPIEITCFYEELAIPLVGEVVPYESAVLPEYTAIGIHSDHREMVRFASQDDPGFISVVGELQRWISSWILGDVKEDFEDKPHTNADISTKETRVGNITVWGDVVQSIVVDGNQTIHGGLSFGA